MGDLETVLEYSPVRDSSGNGLAEKGVQTIESLVRTHLLDLDEKLQCKLPLDGAWFTWLVEFCADIHNRNQVGEDGRTPWERLKGRKCHGYITEFGRKVLHRVPGKLTGGVMQARFYGGVYVGKRLESNESLVSGPDGGVVKVRDYRDVSDEIAFDSELLKNICGTHRPPTHIIVSRLNRKSFCQKTLTKFRGGGIR